MPLHKIKAVFFDAAGTLFTVKGSVGEIYACLAREHGKEVAVTDLESRFRHCFATTPAMAFPEVVPQDLARIERQWWRDLVQRIFAPLGPFPEFATYFDALFAWFARAEVWQLYPETIETLLALKSRNLYLEVVSNFDSRLFGLLDGLQIANFFDPVIISTRAGYAKPAVEIFTQALAYHNLRPDEALHVGDSLQADIVGARAAGLAAVLIDRKGKDHQTEGYYRVKSLGELSAVIDQVENS